MSEFMCRQNLVDSLAFLLPFLLAAFNRKTRLVHLDSEIEFCLLTFFYHAFILLATKHWTYTEIFWNNQVIALSLIGKKSLDKLISLQDWVFSGQLFPKHYLPITRSLTPTLAYLQEDCYYDIDFLVTSYLRYHLRITIRILNEHLLVLRLAS